MKIEEKILVAITINNTLLRAILGALNPPKEISRCVDVHVEELCEAMKDEHTERSAR